MTLSHNLNRRRVLRGMAGGVAATVGLPLLDCFLDTNGTALASGAALPTCFGTWFWGLGLNVGQWAPKATDASYVPDRELRATPDVSPLYADLRGLPPTMLAVGTADSLVDDTVFLATRLLASGVECELELVPGAEHAFDGGPIQPYQESVAVVDGFLSGHARRPH